MMIRVDRNTNEKTNFEIANTSFLKAFASERFYLESVTFYHLLDELQNHFGYGSRKELIRSLRNFGKGLTISTKVHSIRGDMLEICLRELGLSLESLQGCITKIAGLNGQGGIRNPRILPDEEMVVFCARLGAIINSDCHLRKDGCLTYYEKYMERIERVEEILEVFGDIELHKAYRKEHGRYEVILPKSLGRAFIYWGFTAGDKPIQNRRLSSIIREGLDIVVCPYLEELISEDGSFDEHSGFSWSRSVVLNAGEKETHYNFESKIGQASIQFIKEHSDVGWNDRNIIGISMPKLKELVESDNQHISKEAQILLGEIYRNRSYLLEDEAELARRLGINVETYPKDVIYSKNTGRFSINWVAHSYRKQDILKWGLLAPPNDKRKMMKLRKWLLKHVEDVENMRRQLVLEGFNLAD